VGTVLALRAAAAGPDTEFFQWNIDLLGSDSPAADGEIVAIAALFLRSLGLAPTEAGIYVNSRRLMEDKLEEMGVGAEGRRNAFRLIDRRDKMQADQWQAWALEMGLSVDQLEALREMLGRSDLWQESDELRVVYTTAEAYGVREYLVYDASIVRGLDYYTGPVFEAYDRPRSLRAILGGGRYDNLVADVGGERISGVGFAMGDAVIEVLLDRLAKRPALPISPGRVLLTLFGGELCDQTLALGARLRQAGVNAVQILEPDRLGKQIRQADRMGIPYVLILGPDEAATGRVVLKELSSGEQVTCSEEEAIARLRGA
jgi:histidyl-tRNA synthetase